MLFIKQNTKLITLNTFCASCKSDEDVKNIQWLPTPFLKYKTIANHPFLLNFKNDREIIELFNKVYLAGIIITCYGCSGVWNVKSLDEYSKFGLNYPFDKILLKNPKFLIFWLLIKTKLTRQFSFVFSIHSKRSGYNID